MAGSDGFRALSEHDGCSERYGLDYCIQPRIMILYPNMDRDQPSLRRSSLSRQLAALTHHRQLLDSPIHLSLGTAQLATGLVDLRTQVVQHVVLFANFFADILAQPQLSLQDGR